MAGRLGVDHQQLQQFLTTSTWQVEAVRARLARRAVTVVRPQVWVVDDTSFPRTACPRPRWPGRFRHAGQGRQLPDRCERPCRLGHRVVSAVVAAGCAPQLGRT
ncbi:transposase [Streptomyces griseus]|uniref:transposase n=1 Tax=Streptomyces griseus TaxID=1911 RepID=UPI00373AE91D